MTDNTKEKESPPKESLSTPVKAETVKLPGWLKILARMYRDQPSKERKEMHGFFKTMNKKTIPSMKSLEKKGVKLSPWKKLVLKYCNEIVKNTFMVLSELDKIDKKDKKEKKPPKYWWIEDHEYQEYDDAFFVEYHERLKPVIPDDYNDSIFNEEWKLLTEKTKGWENAGPSNLNFPNLFKLYDDKVSKEFKEKKITVAILMPTGDGMMHVNCGTAMATMYKPNHRYHTVQGHNIGILRNMLVNMALSADDVTHVLFLDSDTIIPPFGLIRMLRRDLDVVCGVYTMKAPPYVPLVIKRPRHVETGEKIYNYYVEITEQLLNKVIEIDGAGAGCLLIKREALEKMGPPWFQVTAREHGLSAIGEDLFFFDRAQDAGYKTWMDLSVQCDHATGRVSYPRVFIEGFALPASSSKKMVDTWNKNAILWSLGMVPMKPPFQGG